MWRLRALFARHPSTIQPAASHAHLQGSLLNALLGTCSRANWCHWRAPSPSPAVPGPCTHPPPRPTCRSSSREPPLHRAASSSELPGWKVFFLRSVPLQPPNLLHFHSCTFLSQPQQRRFTVLPSTWIMVVVAVRPPPSFMGGPKAFQAATGEERQPFVRPGWPTVSTVIIIADPELVL